MSFKPRIEWLLPLVPVAIVMEFTHALGRAHEANNVGATAWNQALELLLGVAHRSKSLAIRRAASRHRSTAPQSMRSGVSVGRW